MSSSARFLAVVLFTVCFVPVYLLAQTPAKSTARIARGSVSGRVTIKDKPAPGVTIGLRQNVNGMPDSRVYRAVTDQEGIYHVTNVPAGTYDIAPAAAAYVVADTTNSPARAKSVIVREDEEVDNINFTLVRGGVITGKITDADGHSLIQQAVYLYRATDVPDPQQQRQIYPANNVQTDDRGVYRFFGIAPGRYRVSCGRGEEAFVGSFSPTRVIYKQVFFPDATDHAKATVIEVREGSEATNIDIALGAPVQTFTASGRVIDEKNLPVPNMRFVFQRNTGTERFEIAGMNAITNIKGEFIADGLTPGKYSVVPFGNVERDSRVETVWFDIIDQDITGLTVRMLKGLTVSGVVVLEPDDKKAFAKLTQFQLRGYVTAAPGAPTVGSSTSTTIAADGSFTLKGLSPGTVSLWFAAPMSPNQPEGFTIVRTEQNGAPVPRGIEVKDGEQVTGVRIIVSYGTATLRGSVTVTGSVPDGARIFARLTKPTTPAQQLAMVPVDARGQFLMEGLPVGVYEISVTTFLSNSRTPTSAKREVTVVDGIVNEVSLTLDLTQPKNP